MNDGKVEIMAELNGKPVKLKSQTNQDKLPEILLEIRRREEEFEIVKGQWKEVQKAAYEESRPELDGMSYKDRIEADKHIIELMRARTLEMARHPQQIEMDFDDIG